MGVKPVTLQCAPPTLTLPPPTKGRDFRRRFRLIGNRVKSVSPPPRAAARNRRRFRRGVSARRAPGANAADCPYRRSPRARPRRNHGRAHMRETMRNSERMASSNVSFAAEPHLPERDRLGRRRLVLERLGASRRSGLPRPRPRDGGCDRRPSSTAKAGFDPFGLASSGERRRRRRSAPALPPSAPDRSPSASTSVGTPRSA